jgi:hypothetical protein
MFAPVRSMRELGGLESFEDISECIAGLEALAPNYNYNTDHSVYGVFEGLVEDLEITPKWVSTLRRFVYGFATKDNDHAEFFGTPYLGTHRIVFKTADRVAFFTDIIDVDENEKMDVYSITGVLLRTQMERKRALDGLREGVYMMGNQNGMIKIFKTNQSKSF